MSKNLQSGAIALQYGGDGVIKWRKAQVKPL
jgi:hypothetical protein